MKHLVVTTPLAVVAVLLGSVVFASGFSGLPTTSEPQSLLLLGAGLVIASGYARSHKEPS